MTRLLGAPGAFLARLAGALVARAPFLCAPQGLRWRGIAHRRRAVVCASLAIALLPQTAEARAESRDPAASICDAAAIAGAEAHGVPLNVMRAVTRTETGRGRGGVLRPWPWTVNMEGEGKWFDSRDAAMAYVRKHHARGARSYDVGCFQINFRWHGEAFSSLEEMFDPAANARYAAKFLSELKSEGGDWSAAVGRYHSRTPSFAEKYKARFARILAALEPLDRRDLPAAHALRPRGRLIAQAAVGAPRFAGLYASAAAPIVVTPLGPAASPGGVSLSLFPNGRGLLTAGRPLGN